jgi:hypothetical protein
MPGGDLMDVLVAEAKVILHRVPSEPWQVGVWSRGRELGWGRGGVEGAAGGDGAGGAESSCTCVPRVPWQVCVSY